MRRSAGSLASSARLPNVDSTWETGSSEPVDALSGGASEETVVELSIEHHTAFVNNVRLHYVTAGRGVPVVLLHGWPQTWYEWRKIIPALAERHFVVAPDLRGLGDSARPATGYDKRTVAEDIYQLVRKLELPSVYLVGHDWGGPVAYAYACVHGDDVRGLVLVDTRIPGAALGESADGPRERGLWHSAFHSVRDLPEALVAGRERTYLSWFYSNLAYNPTAIGPEDIDEYVRCYSAPGALRAGFEYYRAADEDAEHNREFARTRKLKLPVLALGGRRGGFGALTKASAEAVAENVRGVVLDRCGHWIPEECPDVLVNELLRFFSEQKTD
jgi:pimeloyl-ACP methyl ester carboxylesterase